MSAGELLTQIRSLSKKDIQIFLQKLLMDDDLRDEIERIGYLRLTEKAFDFWNDPKEDVYQDFARAKS